MKPGPHIAATGKPTCGAEGFHGKTAASKFGSSPAKLRFLLFCVRLSDRYEFQKNITARADPAHRGSGTQDLGQDPHAPRRINRRLPGLVPIALHRNNGAAFGMHIATKGGFDWGKLLLGIFRIVMVGVIGWLMHHLINKRKDTPKGVIVGLALVMAGALGNIIDSAFYGLLFSESTPYTVAHFGGHYAGFMMGKVVDMFYFPLFQWNGVPRFLNFLVDSNNYFSEPSSTWPMPISPSPSSICFCFSTNS